MIWYDLVCLGMFEFVVAMQVEKKQFAGWNLGMG